MGLDCSRPFLGHVRVSTRLINGLGRLLDDGYVNRFTLQQVLDLAPEDVLDQPNLGRRSLAELTEALAAHGLALTEPEAPDLKNWNTSKLRLWHNCVRRELTRRKREPQSR